MRGCLGYWTKYGAHGRGHGSALVDRMRFKPRRLVVAVVAVIVLAVAGGLAALRYGAALLKQQIEAGLGPEAEVGSIVLEGGSVVVYGVRVRAPTEWPTSDALRAEKIVVEPDLRALLSGDVHIASVTAENVYLAVLRSRNGAVQLLPSLLARGATSESDVDASDRAGGSDPRRVLVDETILSGGVVEIFDALVRTKPHRTRIAEIRVEVGEIAFPAFDTDTSLDVAGIVEGPNHDGTVTVKGHIHLDDLDSEITTSLRGLDLVALEPYLVPSSEAGVKRGTLDLDITSTISDRVLTAPGSMTLSHLELEGNSFMGLPRQAVLAALKDHRETITIRFELAGSLDDPHFSLHENFMLRTSTAIAESLGLSIRGLARGVGGATQTFTDKLGDLLGR